ncbi:hypothetical protein TVAG_068920 [Trichomonas vaginalis G3]|uniref:Raptor N-terminal CASPase-like domain-containing protein n=1 Tax=Trichomonas vaginalis (strain ATCC PRA-98 / G3) TaxID=412133 RepID=A2EZL7_TRIV3|nr:regulatory-associateD protein of MTOR family [Trichomonas vaginalis G3]EAY01925.1 hypothetical protein TVAG_068920 [Trichomonas vaginalis G3]KAI5485295.1 regulatory-associateD protein of MTOR family [Trichomonas vaginalis G3]|eukprot:XP_001330443.1 hypothetical protein [Trichomonas vaginalis G3]
MKRTGAMKFDEYESSGYEYSDGETSDDLKNDKPIQQNPVKPTIFKKNEQHIQSINKSMIDDSKNARISTYNDSDYDLDQKLVINKDFVFPGTHLTENVFILIAHPAQFSKVEVEYSEKNPYYAWQYTNAPLTDFSTGVNTTYKSAYQSIHPSFKVNILVSPSAEKLNQLQNFRRDAIPSRVIFHYIGYGFPQVDKSNIFLCDGKPNVFRPYPARKIFENLKTPSFFIFDCNNAGAMLQVFDSTANKQKLKNKSPTSSQKIFTGLPNIQSDSNWDDWICLCATDVNETLPTNAQLPRDFLTTCLFSPVAMSILCHIIQYYHTSFPDPGFPLNEINGILAFGDKMHRQQLEDILCGLTDAIASDCLKPQLYKNLFRQDPAIATFFRNFILSQYLLAPYDVHPVSYPSFASMTRHPLWLQWRTSIDQWITSTLTPLPSFATDFFGHAINSFQHYLSTKLDSRMKMFLVTILCHVPFSEVANNPKCFPLLAKFASRSKENRQKLAQSIIFKPCFLLLSNTKNTEEFNSLCYIIFSMLYENSGFISEIRNDIDYQLLLRYVFDTSISEKTRTIICGIITLLVSNLNNINPFINNKEFHSKLKNVISTASSPLLHWILLLMSQSFNGISIDPDCFVPDSIHFQISLSIFHGIFWCRAAAINALQSYFQQGDQIINLHLILMILPSFMDCSYTVRMQLVNACAKFLHQNAEMFIIGYRKSQVVNSAATFSQLFALWYDDMKLNTLKQNFSEFLLKLDEVAHRNDSISHICTIVYYIIDMLSHDPHPFVKKRATIFRGYFQRLTMSNHGTNNEGRPHSVSPPFALDNLQKGQKVSFSEDESEHTEDTEIFPSDITNDSLLSSSIQNLLRAGPDWIEQPKIENKSEMSTYSLKIQSTLVAEGRLFKFSPTHIDFDPISLDSAVATSNKFIFSVDETNKIVNKIRLSDYDITDLQCTRIGNDKVVVASTGDGCVHLWNPSYSTPFCSFRADANYNIDNIAQLCRCKGDKLFTTRGNSGIAMWDITKQMLVGEWPSEEQHIASAMCLSPSNENMIYVGYANGYLNAVDIRDPDAHVRRLTITLGDRISQLSASGELIYASTPGGKCAIWNIGEATLSTLRIPQGPPKHFIAHKHLPLLFTNDNVSSPQCCGPDGLPLMQFIDVPSQCIFTVHPTLPAIAFASSAGDMYTYMLQ